MANRKFTPVEEAFRQNKEDPILPKRSTRLSAGYDFAVPSEIVLLPNSITTVWTDVKACIPAKEVLMVYIRSSLAKKGITLANGTGIIDSDYYGNPSNDGNIGLMLLNSNSSPFVIDAGDKVAQGIFLHFETVSNEETIISHRNGGFGSTDLSMGERAEDDLFDPILRKSIDDAFSGKRKITDTECRICNSWMKSYSFSSEVVLTIVNYLIKCKGFRFGFNSAGKLASIIHREGLSEPGDVACYLINMHRFRRSKTGLTD